MKHIIITGGAASGKSSVAKALIELSSCEYFSADDCVHELLTKPKVAKILESEFGTSVLNPCGEIDRPTLRAVVFSSSRQRARLEQILHPLVFSALNEQLTNAESDNAEAFVSEIPLYFESGAKISPHLIVVVACSQATQILRLCQRPGINEELAKEIISSQMPTLEKMNQSDAVVWNDGSDALMRDQIDLILR